MRRVALAVPATLALPAATACGAPSENDSQAAEGEEPLVVGATAVPAGDILEFVESEPAPEAGLVLEIHEYSDDIADPEEGSEVALPNDPTNEFRALLLLEEGGLITLADGIDEATFSLSDIEENPLDLDFREVEAAQPSRSLDDVDAAIVNNNYAQEAGLDFEEDSILLEEFADNPYVNGLAARADNAEDPRIAALVELLTSPETVRFVEETYDGSVIPAIEG